MLDIKFVLDIKILLVYAIIHLLSVIHMFNIFEHEGYIPDSVDKWVVWLFAPEIVVITFIRALGEIRK